MKLSNPPSTRIQILTTSFELIKDNLLMGIGFGNFGSYARAFDSDVNFYAHNIFVEVLTECGIVAFILLILLVKETFTLGKGNIFVNSLFIFTFVNALFSGDVPGNSMFFISMYVVRIFSEKEVQDRDAFGLFQTRLTGSNVFKRSKIRN